MAVVHDKVGVLAIACAKRICKHGQVVVWDTSQPHPLNDTLGGCTIRKLLVPRAFKRYLKNPSTKISPLIKQPLFTYALNDFFIKLNKKPPSINLTLLNFIKKSN